MGKCKRSPKKTGEPNFYINKQKKLGRKERAIIKLLQLGIKFPKNENYSEILNDSNSNSYLENLRKKVNDEFQIEIEENPQAIFSNVMEKEINDFLNSFIIKIEQPNLTEMLEKLKKPQNSFYGLHFKILFFFLLYIKSKVHYITIFNNIFFTFNSQLPCFFYFCF